jgi:hypothetical protein
VEPAYSWGPLDIVDISGDVLYDVINVGVVEKAYSTSGVHLAFLDRQME